MAQLPQSNSKQLRSPPRRQCWLILLTMSGLWAFPTARCTCVCCTSKDIEQHNPPDVGIETTPTCKRWQHHGWLGTLAASPAEHTVWTLPHQTLSLTHSLCTGNNRPDLSLIALLHTISTPPGVASLQSLHWR